MRINVFILSESNIVILHASKVKQLTPALELSCCVSEVLVLLNVTFFNADLFCSLKFPKCFQQGLAHGRLSINTCWKDK